MNDIEKRNRAARDPAEAAQQPHAGAGRPVGVGMIAAIALLTAGVFGLRIFGAIRVLSGSVPGVDPAASTVIPQLIVPLVLLPVCIATGVGLWRLKEWGRYLAIGCMVLAIVNLFVQSFSAPRLSVGLLNALSVSMLPGAILLYLLHPSIRTAFHTDRGRRM